MIISFSMLQNRYWTAENSAYGLRCFSFPETAQEFLGEFIPGPGEDGCRFRVRFLLLMAAGLLHHPLAGPVAGNEISLLRKSENDSPDFSFDTAGPLYFVHSGIPPFLLIRARPGRMAFQAFFSDAFCYRHDQYRFLDAAFL